METENVNERDTLSLGLWARIRAFGLKNLLYCWDFCVFATALTILSVLAWSGRLSVSQSMLSSMTDVGMTLAVPLAAMAIGALAIVTSLSSDPFLLFLETRKRLDQVVFPFYWTSVVWLVVLTIGFGVKVSSWLHLVPVSAEPYVFGAYVSIMMYALLATYSVVEAVQLFITVRGAFVQAAVEEAKEQQDLQAQHELNRHEQDTRERREIVEASISLGKRVLDSSLEVATSRIIEGIKPTTTRRKKESPDRG